MGGKSGNWMCCHLCEIRWLVAGKISWNSTDKRTFQTNHFRIWFWNMRTNVPSFIEFLPSGLFVPELTLNYNFLICQLYENSFVNLIYVCKIFMQFLLYNVDVNLHPHSWRINFLRWKMFWILWMILCFKMKKLKRIH